MLSMRFNIVRVFLGVAITVSGFAAIFAPASAIAHWISEYRIGCKVIFPVWDKGQPEVVKSPWKVCHTTDIKLNAKDLCKYYLAFLLDRTNPYIRYPCILP